MKKDIRFFKKLLVTSLILTLICGCVRIKEASRIILGTSVSSLEKARINGKTQTFNYDYEKCYKKVLLILRQMNVYIYLHSLKERRIVAMNFEGANKTTEVGIFFEEITPSSTKVEISCLAPSVLENVSEKIFIALKGK
ncbi:MAG: hypothetical protein Q8O13_03095 [Candidatus Omnitrophota bacterium]|nr:hypothetical protein [Candidatus Omnitrophota bacterium]